MRVSAWHDYEGEVTDEGPMRRAGERLPFLVSEASIEPHGNDGHHRNQISRCGKRAREKRQLLRSGTWLEASRRWFPR